MSEFTKQLDRIKALVDRIESAGAEQVDAFFEWGRNTDVTARDGEVENLKQSVSTGVGLRVFYRNRLGFGYTSDITPDGLRDLGERVFAIAKETAADENNGLPPTALLQPRTPTPEIFDVAVEALPSDWLARTAIEMEKASLGYDPRVKTCEEVGAGSNMSRVALINSQGLSDQYQATYVWTYSVVVAEENGQKQAAWLVDYATHLNDLKDPVWVAQTAAWKAVRMLGARKIETAEMPIVLEPELTMSLVGNLFDAIDGDMIYKKSSFLVDKLNEKIASAQVTLVDDGTLPRRTSSRPFDGEGLPTRRHAVIDKGVLKKYIYDTYTANKAGAKPTGTASRGYASLPSIGRTNAYIEPGETAAKDLLKGIDRGLLITDMMGRGVDVVNGDYSRGASGIFIRDGEPAYPVQEVTVSGNLLQMLTDIDAVGNDLTWRGGLGAPSIRFTKLTVSGK